MEKLYENSIEKLLDIFVWNLHGAASWENNYSLKPLVVDKIFSKKSDIICLTEVVLAEGFDYLLKTAHNQGYVSFHNLQSAANGILFFVKKDLIKDFPSFRNRLYHESIIKMEIDTEEPAPNFLQLRLPLKGFDEDVYLIGCRVQYPLERKNRVELKNQQRENLREHIRKLRKAGASKVIIVGDFNAIPSYMKDFIPEDFVISSPLEMEGEKDIEPFSFVFKDGNKAALDYAITYGFIAENMSYDYSFLTENPEPYNHRTKFDHLSYCKGLPDHAIFTSKLIAS